MAASTPAFKVDGSKAAAAAKLDDAVFGVVPKNHELLKSVYVAYLANGRTRNARAKTRGDVSGGGKKPWKQKGTGRARFGSSRNPIWRGGGIAFGPTGLENFTHRINVKAKRLAIRQALSLAAVGGKVVVLDDFTPGKTAEAAGLLDKVGAVRHTLVVVDKLQTKTVRATNNLPKTRLVEARYLNVFDILNADIVVITKSALSALSAWLATDPTQVKKASKEEAAS